MTLTATAPATATCPHGPGNHARANPHRAPFPCPYCRGWATEDGHVISTAEAYKRYPNLPRVLPQQQPDYRPGVADRLEAFGQASSRAGKDITAMVFFLVVVAVVLFALLAHAH